VFGLRRAWGLLRPRAVKFGFSCFGFDFAMSRSMFLTSPFQPPPPMNLNLTFLGFIYFGTVLVMVLTVVWLSEPML
jgi:hypothetical protein